MAKKKKHTKQEHEEAHEDTHTTKAHGEGEHKKKVKKPAAARHHRRKGSPFWMWVSLVLGVLLIASVLTNGFSMQQDPADSAISSIEEMKEQVDSQQLQKPLEEAQRALAVVKDQMEKSAETGENGTGTAQMDMYLMSQCPYGTQAMNAIAPVKEKLGDALDLNMEYIMSGPARYEGKSDQYCVSGLCSMHGVPEVQGNIVQLCAMEHNPDKYLDLLTCMNQNADNIPGNWESCAKENNLDVEAIRQCYEGDEGMQLAEASANASRARGASASPTIYINDQKYNGDPRSSDALLRAVCNSLEERPEACSDVPEPTEVELTVVNDERCDNCDTSRVLQLTRNLFPGLTVEEVGAQSDKGKELIEEYNLERGPAYLFSDSVEDTQRWSSNSRMQQAFAQVGDRYKLKPAQTGAQWFFDEEKRKEQQQQQANYPEENLEKLGYNGSKPRLDYFVMAFCPYGNPADKSASELHDLFGDKVEIVPHYILSMEGGSVSSMHGQQEANQGVRELCALQELGKDAYYDFTLATNDMCSSKDADSCWTEAAKEANVSTEAISQCMEADKQSLAREEVELNQNLRTERKGQLVPPSASPTFLINGETYSGSRDTESLKKAICEEFEQPPEECGQTMDTGDSGQQAAGQC